VKNASEKILKLTIHNQDLLMRSRQYAKYPKSAFATILVISLLLLGIPEANGQPKELNKLEVYLENAMIEWNIPGVAIGVVKDDKVVYARGFGVREIKKKEPVDANTVFAIASNTKIFTALALGLLVQEGKISWDDPVLKYHKEFQMYDPMVTRKITIRDMLCHNSGLGKWAGDLMWFGSSYDRQEVIRRIRYIAPVSDFRTSYHYTNLMFLVAGEIIPVVTGISWDHFVKQRFFQPLDMNRSNTSVKDLLKMKNVATPYTVANGGLVSVSYIDGANSGSAGAINSCINDMMRWLRLQLGSGVFNGRLIVSHEIITETRKPHNLKPVSDNDRKINPFTHFKSYGLGLNLQDYRGELLIDHTGGLDGMYSYVGFLPEKQLGVVVLTNRDDHSLMEALPLYIYDAYLGVEIVDWSKRYLDDFKSDELITEMEQKRREQRRVKKTNLTHSLENYAGIYKSLVYGTVEIEEKNGDLVLRLSAHPQISGKLEHWQYDTFLATWDHVVWRESLVYFDLGEESEITRFRMSVRPDWIDTREYTFEKIR
jgi:CubicO group peptidase (beta-lactamase class C family)